MTSAAAAAGRPWDRIATLAHYPMQLGVVLFACDLSIHLGFIPDTVQWIALAGLIAGTVLYWQAQYLHRRRRLCTKCSRGAPLDPQAAVAARMRWLKLNHRMTDTAWGFLPAGLVAGLLAPGLFSPSLKWVGALIWLVILGPAVLLQIHTPLQPWCPFCRWGRGDDGDEEPSPDPTPDPSEAPHREVTT